MSNLHKDLDESNLHAPKGFTLVGNNTRPWKDENDASTYTENFELPRAINFVDGTAVAPSSADGDIYVLIGSGVLDASWGTIPTFGDWVRATNGAFIPITPIKGTLCYDDTASSWMEFDGAVWGTFGGGGGSDTNLATNDLTLTDPSRFYNVNGNDFQFKDGANNRLRINSNGVAIGNTATPVANTALNVVAGGATSGFIGLNVENSTGLSFLRYKGDGSLTLEATGIETFKIDNTGGITSTSNTQQLVHNIINTDATGRSTIQMDNDGGLKTYYRLYGSNIGNTFLNNKLLNYSANGVVHQIGASESYFWTLGSASEANTDMRLNTTGLLLGQGIGASTPSAQLHVKGGFLVQNTSSLDTFKISSTTGDVTQTSRVQNYVHNIINADSTGRSTIQMDNDGGLRTYIRLHGSANSESFLQDNLLLFNTNSLVNRVNTGNFYWNFNGSSDATCDMKLDTTGLLLGDGIGASSSSARLHVKGSFLVQNTSSLDTFKINSTTGDITQTARVQNYVHNIINADSTGRSTIQMDNDGGLRTYIRLHGSANSESFLQDNLLLFNTNSLVNRVNTGNFYWNFNGSSDATCDMKLDTTGLLLGDGIGATAVGAKLHVIGSTLLNGNLGVFGATPIAQPTTAHAAATFVANTSGIADDTATFDGYTMGQIVKALRDLGALA